MGNAVNHLLEFGPFRIDPEQRLLLRDQEPISLSPKAFDLLLALAERSGQVVLKDDLMKLLWPDTFVEESNLGQHVFQLRKALGDRSQYSAYIVTAPGRGYRFVQEVRTVPVASAHEEEIVLESRSQVVVKRDEEPNPFATKLALTSDKRWIRTVIVLAALAAFAIVFFARRQTGRVPELKERQLTANPFEDWVTSAAISPDGKYVAYHDQTGLYLRSIDTGETHPVSLPAEIRIGLNNLCWFPGGGKLLADVASADGYDIWVITVLGEGEPHLLYRHGIDPAVSPDGRMIAFINWEDGKARQEVWVGGMNGETPRKLVDAAPVQKVYSPAWSPDSHWIAYGRRWKTAQGSWSSAIEVRPASGGAARTLVAESNLPTPDTIYEFAQSWSPDWRLLFSVTDRPYETKYSLWDVRVESSTVEVAGKPEQLTQWNEFFPLKLAVTADGKRLSLVRSRAWSDVYLGELGPNGASMKAPRRLTLDNRGSELDAWRRDSQAILLDSFRNGRVDIYRQSLNGNVAEIVASGARNTYGAEMSPDGHWWVYWESAPDPDGKGVPYSLMRLAVGGGSPEKVLELSTADVAGSVDSGSLPGGFYCSTNQKANSPCVLGMFEGKDFAFYSLDPVRGKGSRLGKIAVTQSSRFIGWCVSPDGSRVALVDQDKYKGRIEVLTTMDGAWHEVSLKPEREHLQSIAWAADGNSFFVTAAEPTSFDLLHVTLAGKVQPLLSNDRRQWIVGPRASPDGKYLAFTAQTYDSNVWMISNF